MSVCSECGADALWLWSYASAGEPDLICSDCEWAVKCLKMWLGICPECCGTGRYDCGILDIHTACSTCGGTGTWLLAGTGV